MRIRTSEEEESAARGSPRGASEAAEIARSGGYAAAPASWTAGCRLCCDADDAGADAEEKEGSAAGRAVRSWACGVPAC